MKRDLRRVTLEQLRAFVSIAEHRSFTDAARLHLRTQTALSRQIKCLEDELGMCLLSRSRGHVEGLTEAGHRLLPFARKVLATVDDAWASLSCPSLSGSIRVGIMDDIDVSWLNKLLSRFQTIHSDCEVRAISDFSVRLERRLEAGEIDAAIIKRLAANGGGASQGQLRREPLVWAAGPGFRWVRAQPLPLVVFHEGCVYRRHLLRQLEGMGVACQVIYDGQSYANIREAVFAGLGLTALAESQVRAGGLRCVRELGGMTLPDLGAVEIAVRILRGQNNPALLAFVREIERQMQDSPEYVPTLSREPETA